MTPPPEPEQDEEPAFVQEPAGEHEPGATNLRLKGPASDGEGEASSAVPPPVSSAPSYIGCTIDGRYRIESIIGEGGMGLVYRARHRVIDKLVAVKILRPEVARHDEVTNRFLIEAKAATAIGNAHIVDTLDFGDLPDGSTYFVMEYLDGRTLTDVMRSDAPLPIERILHIAKQIAEALGSAHAAAIVHRDLKPDNVFLVDRDRQPDFVKILDFGIAKVESVQNRLTRAGAVFGTPHYMSPEQASGASADHRSDIYALGVILYELVTLRVPFDAEAPLGILAQHLNDDPVPPTAISGLRRPVPVDLEAVILKCLAKNRADRYQSMAEVISELERLETGLRPVASEELRARRLVAELVREPPPLERRSPGRAGMWLAGALLLVAIGVAAQARLPASPHGVVPRIFARTAPDEVILSSAVPKAESSAQAQTMRSVALVLSPIDAHVFRGGKDLGAMPITLPIAPGESIPIEVRRQGYWTRRANIDDSADRVIIRLVPASSTQPPSSASVSTLPPVAPVVVPPAVTAGPIDEPAAAEPAKEAASAPKPPHSADVKPVEPAPGAIDKGAAAETPPAVAQPSSQPLPPAPTPAEPSPNTANSPAP